MAGVAVVVYVEGHLTHLKKRTKFLRTKEFIRIFDGFFLKTKGFLPKFYEIFGSEIPLGLCYPVATVCPENNAKRFEQLCDEYANFSIFSIYSATAQIFRRCEPLTLT